MRLFNFKAFKNIHTRNVAIIIIASFDLLILYLFRFIISSLCCFIPFAIHF